MLPTDPVLRLSLGRLVIELLLGLAVARAFAGGRWPGAVVLVAALVGLTAGRGLSLNKKRRPQRAAHLTVIGAALSACSLGVEARSGAPTGATLAPIGLLAGAAIWDLARERAERLKEPLRPSPMSALTFLGGAAAGVVLGAMPVARVTGLALALAVLAAMVTLAATFGGVPGRPTAKPFDAAVLIGAGALGLTALGLVALPTG